VNQTKTKKEGSTLYCTMCVLVGMKMCFSLYSDSAQVFKMYLSTKMIILPGKLPCTGLS